MASSSSFLLKVKLALGVGLVLVATVGVASYVTISRLMETAQVRAKTEDTLVLLERVAASIKAIESSAQQYLLSGTVIDLQVYQQMRVAAREAIGRIRKARLLPEQASLDELVAQRRILADQTIAARQSAGQEAGVAIFNSDLSRQLRQRTDGLLETARKRETLAWQDTQAAAQRSAQWAQRLIIAGALLFLSMLAWVVLEIGRAHV